MLKMRRVLVTGSLFALAAAALAAFYLRSGKTTADSAPDPQFLIAARQNFKPLSLPAELPSATGYKTVDAFPGLIFRAPLALATPPGEKDRLFVVERYGGISLIDHLSTKPEKRVFLNINKVLDAHGWELATGRPNGGEWGVLGMAFHPQYAKNGFFFLSYDFTVRENGEEKSFDRVSRFSVSKTNPNEADPKSEVPLITQLDLYDNHNAGDIHFGDDGYLYMSLGDEGGPTYMDDFNNARFIDKDFFAGVLRLDVDNRPGNLPPSPHHQDSTTFPSAVGKGSYSIPKDNPYVGVTTHRGMPVDTAKLRSEFYVSGLRNPWRFSIDSTTGRIFIGNVGLDTEEMVDIVDEGGPGKGGEDFGWPAIEGTIPGPHPDRTAPGAVLSLPGYFYNHSFRSNDPFTGNCLIGGEVYNGTKFPELLGAYIFGDYSLGKVWAIRESSVGKGDWKPQLLGTGIHNACFGTDPRNGDILIGEFTSQDDDDNIIQRLERAGTTGTPPPKLLSQTGAFTSVAKLTPSPALVPYQPNVTFWSDYALKSRWFSIPDITKKIGFNATGNWTFPTGTVWVKHFDMEMRRGDPSSRRRLETRFLVKTPGSVYGITYKWNAAQTDATLVSEAGEDETLNIEVDGKPQKQVWHYPSQTECMVCHTQVAGQALGFNTFQLNGNGGGAENQLVALQHAGYFSGNIPDTKTLPAYAAADDDSQPLEWRVRSYLAANCVQCHQPGGVAQGHWDARASTPTDQAGLIDGMLAYDRGDKQARWAIPEDPTHSMVLKRIEGNGAPRMPPLASNALDPHAIKLLTDWINSLPPEKAAK